MAAPKKKQTRKPAPKEVVDIPSRIKEAMNELGWPERGQQAELARRSGLSPGQVSAILSKERSEGIQASMVLRIADAMEVNPGWLLSGRGAMFDAHAPTITLKAMIRDAVTSAMKDAKSG